MEQIQSDYPNQIDLYMSYDYLPLKQQAIILTAISGIYETILKSSISHYPSIDRLTNLLIGKPYTPSYPPLSILSANTGESIRFKFDIDRKFLPKFVPNGEDIDVYIPIWSAAVVITGAILTGGLHGYKEILEIQKLHYELEEFELKELESKPASYKIEMYLNQFNYEINQYNINQVEINGRTPNSDSNQ